LAINTLQRLEHALNKSESYKLFVEKNSASHQVLMNGSINGIMHRLYRKMEQQGSNESYLLNSVEEGVQILLNRDKTVVFAGRQTLFFNMKRFGIKNFQMSEKLFTRYSAISLQKGCLFLEKLNEKLEKNYVVK
jgi:glutamate receptor, ionotropic, invertebrate